MAANNYKRDICNRALMILNAGRTDAADNLYEMVTDEQFANWTAVPKTQSQLRICVFAYERILKQVLLDIQPDFAVDYADLGDPVSVNRVFGGWDYLFHLPADYLGLVKQVAEADHLKDEALNTGYRCEVLFFKDYAHVVVGSDDGQYYCTTAHTSADDSADGEPPDDDGNGNWIVFDEDVASWVEIDAAAWAEGLAYKASGTDSLLATNDLTNEAGDSAYIKYLAYVRAGRSDQPQYWPESFANAFATRLAAEMAQDSKDYERRVSLLQEYERLAKPAAWSAENWHKAAGRPKTAFERRLTG